MRRAWDTTLSSWAKPDATRINIDKLQERLDREDHRLVCSSLDEVDLGSALELLETYSGRGLELRPWLKDAEINRDGDLRLQYLAGMGLNSYAADDIYRALMLHRKHPDDLLDTTDAPSGR